MRSKYLHKSERILRAKDFFAKKIMRAAAQSPVCEENRFCKSETFSPPKVMTASTLRK